jgi:hypothetical protein
VSYSDILILLRDNLSCSDIERASQCIIDPDLDTGLMNQFLMNHRLLKPKTILKIINNIAKAENKLINLSSILNRIIVWKHITGQNRDIIPHVLSQDNRKIRPLLLDLVDKLYELSYREALDILDDISNTSGVDRLDIFYALLKRHDVSNSSDLTRLEMFVQSMSSQTKYDMLVKAYIDGHFLFSGIIKKTSIDKEFLDTIIENLDDESGFCLAIRNSPVSISWINKKILTDIFIRHHSKVPKTIDFIFKQAVAENLAHMFEFFIPVVSKRNILRALINAAEIDSKNDAYLRIFLKTHKNSEEIRHLVPFI